nr:alpha/beta hydrolase [Bdellovibrio sp. HM001]
MANGRNWLLLRGLARGVGHWGSFAETIQKHFPEDRFEFLDLPGNGSRHLESSPLRIADYVKDLRLRCSYVKNGQPFQILSVSLGSMITVEWMREYPHEVKRAFLTCTSSAGLSPFYHRFYLANVPQGLKLLGKLEDAELWEKTVLGMIVNNQERREAELPAMIEYSRKYPMNPTNVFRQLLAASQYRFPAQPPGEVKLLGSHGDRLVSAKCTLKIAEQWGLKAQMHPWAGHDVPVDDPQWLLEQLL